MSCPGLLMATDEVQNDVQQVPEFKPATSDPSETIMLVSPPCDTQNTTAGDAMGVDMQVVKDASNAENLVTAEGTPRSPEGASPQENGDDKTKIADSSSSDRDQNDEETDKNEVGMADNHDHCNGMPVEVYPLPQRRPKPRRPGWGRHPDEEIFHIVPQSHGSPDQKRAIFCFWPRASKAKGNVIIPKARGKFSPDGYPWGATLYDIFGVNRCADDAINMVSYMTGSALLEAMKEMGELDLTQDQVEWAMSEGNPRDEGVANTGELIESMERRLQLITSKDVRDKASETKSAGKDTQESEEVQHDDDEDEDDDEEVQDDDEDQKEPPSTVPLTSPLHPSHYPPPWPLVPFKSPMPAILQERLPLYLLPQKMYVHDPFGLLNAQHGKLNDVSWMSRPDVIRTYNLELSESVRKEVEEARRKAEELEEFKARTLIILRYRRTNKQIKNHQPMIEVPLPPYPCRTTKVEESHLYISPTSKIGDGNHSIVYKAEWELPRDLFLRPKLCQSCFKRSVDEEMEKLKKSGRWDRMLDAFGWGPTGSTGCGPNQDELDEVREPAILEKDGEIIEREITCVIPPDVSPMRVFLQVVDESDDIWDALMKKRHVNRAMLTFPRVSDSEEVFEGAIPLIRLNPPVAYESQRTCDHLRPFAVPRTATFTVVAKLSLEHDRHIVTEGRSYQEFPEHFFRHYNGYTIIKQLHSIVPVGAVVPQFYGYYMPEKKDGGSSSYLSPILLLEHCGKMIEPEDLSVEDQEECASLLLRFHRAGWIHESIAARNFMVQRGKPTEFPIDRQECAHPSFRLIDFGRSKKYKTAKEKQKQKEELWGLQLFTKLAESMGVTLPRDEEEDKL